MDASSDQSKIIGFTLSPPPQDCNSNFRLFYIWCEKIHKALKTFCKKYMYYHEFDSTGRLHFHGVILIYDRLKFKKNSWNLRKLGFVKFEMRQLGTKWFEYIKKDLEETHYIYNNEVPNEFLPVTTENYKDIKNYCIDNYDKRNRSVFTDYLSKVEAEPMESLYSNPMSGWFD